MHMLSDLIALIIGFYATKIATRSRTDKHTCETLSLTCHEC